MPMQVELLPIDSLLPHEQVIEKKVVQLLEVTLQWGCYTKLVIVDGKTGVLLDAPPIRGRSTSGVTPIARGCG